MSNSSLVTHANLSPNCNEPREKTIKKITIHHMAGALTVEQCGAIFADSSRQASSNYGVDGKGNVGLYVDEANRSWCSSNGDNDHQAITIEVANDGGADTDWHVSDTAFNKLIDLCVDICERNGIESLVYTGGTSGNLTIHKMFSSTTCPGPYLESRMTDIANLVNARLGGTVEEETTITKTNDEIADEVIAGKWGNGTARETAIENAGYDYATIQKLVNAKLGASTTTTVTKDYEAVATAVIRGDYGNGTARITALKDAGFTSDEILKIQNIVNSRY